MTAVPPLVADAALAKARDLGDCEVILRNQFPDSTSDERIEAIRLAHRRVLEKFFGPKRRPKRRMVTG